MSDGDLDPRAVLIALGYPEARALEPVLGGWETSLWRFETPDGQRHALRVYPGPEHAGSARREEAALHACMDAGVPAPAVEATGQWEGRPLLVIGWCQGATLLDAMVRRPWSVWRHGIAFGRLQAQLHRVSPPAALLEGAPHNWVLRGALQRPEVFVRMQSVLPSTDSFIHLDYHPLNVLTDGRHFTGIIDWSNSAAGDRRADFARTATLLLTASSPPGLTRPVVRAFRRLFYLAWRRGYVSEAGSLSDLAPFMAWAGVTRLQDLDDARSRPQSWASEDDFAAARRWVERWKRRAGIP